MIDFLYKVVAPGPRQAIVRPPESTGSIRGGMGFYAQFFQGPRRTPASALLNLILGGPLDSYRRGVADVLLLASAEPEAEAGFCGRPAFRHFEDSGLVMFQDESTETYFTLYCGPWIGCHAWEHATGPCDRMTTEIGEGHFELTVKGVKIFNTPDKGYSLRPVLRSCLFIDGQGQRGDIGYSMSIPDSDLPKGRIVWAAATAEGCEVELELGIVGTL